MSSVTWHVTPIDSHSTGASIGLHVGCMMIRQKPSPTHTRFPSSFDGREPAQVPARQAVVAVCCAALWCSADTPAYKSPHLSPTWAVAPPPALPFQAALPPAAAGGECMSWKGNKGCVLCYAVAKLPTRPHTSPLTSCRLGSWPLHPRCLFRGLSRQQQRVGRRLLPAWRGREQSC